jgi:hypothetical protein
VQDVTAATDPLTERLDLARIKPAKSHITVKFISLVWTPYWRQDERLRPAWE